MEEKSLVELVCEVIKHIQNRNYGLAEDTADKLSSKLVIEGAFGKTGAPKKVFGKKKDLHYLIIGGLTIDGGHHKQWYIEQIAECLGIDIEKLKDECEWEEGIAP